MAQYIKNGFKIGCIIIGTVMGAGFASGQEILQFFTAFRQGGFKGIILAGVLFFIVNILVLKYIFEHKVDSYSSYLRSITGEYTAYIIEITVMLFLLSGFFIMIAGTGAFTKEFFGIPEIYGALFLAGLCCIVFLFDIRGVVSINTLIAPVLVIGILIIGIYIGGFVDMPVSGMQGKKLVTHWFSASVIYVSYNSILLIAILSNLRSYIYSPKTILIGVSVGTGILITLALLIYFITGRFYLSAVSSEMPIIRIIKDLGLPLAGIYGIVLFCAMFTSAVSSGFCFLNRISDFVPTGQKINAFLVCSLGLLLSSFSFSEMIGWVYPIFGYLGLFQVIVIICEWVLTHLLSPCLFKK